MSADCNQTKLTKKNIDNAQIEVHNKEGASEKGIKHQLQSAAIPSSNPGLIKSPFKVQIFKAKNDSLIAGNSGKKSKLEDTEKDLLEEGEIDSFRSDGSFDGEGQGEKKEEMKEEMRFLKRFKTRIIKKQSEVQDLKAMRFVHFKTNKNEWRLKEEDVKKMLK